MPHHPVLWVGREPENLGRPALFWGARWPVKLSAENPKLPTGFGTRRKPNKYPQVATQPGVDVRRLCRQLRRVSHREAGLGLHSTSITAELFDELTRYWDKVYFYNCIFEEGWWAIPTNVPRRTYRFDLRHCVAAPVPPEFEIGFLAWSELKAFWIEEGFQRPGISTLEPEETPKPFDFDYPWAARDFTRALWHDGIAFYLANEMDSIDYLAELPVVKGLHTLRIDHSSVTPEVFAWAVQHKKLVNLWMAWKDWTPDWRELRHLPKLEQLDVTCPALDDAQFAQILESTRAPMIFTEDGSLSVKSLRLALESSTLEWWFAPPSAFTEPLPADVVVDKNRHLEVRVEFIRSEPPTMASLRERFPQVYWDTHVDTDSVDAETTIEAE
jgi:hypothetical protein